jgi:hypothetical protein
MAGGVVHIQWYATVFRGDRLADGIVEMAVPVAMRYGATRYSVQRSQDDAYRILQMIWFDSKDDWYRYWEGPELIEFRARFMGKYQTPLVYVWHDEIAADEMPATPVRPRDSEDEESDTEPQAAA